MESRKKDLYHFIIDKFKEYDFERSEEYNGDASDNFITYEALKNYQDRCVNCMDSIQLSFFENIKIAIQSGQISLVDKDNTNAFECSGFYLTEKGIRFFQER